MTKSTELLKAIKLIEDFDLDINIVLDRIDEFEDVYNNKNDYIVSSRIDILKQQIFINKNDSKLEDDIILCSEQLCKMITHYNMKPINTYTTLQRDEEYIKDRCICYPCIFSKIKRCSIRQNNIIDIFDGEKISMDDIIIRIIDAAKLIKNGEERNDN